MIPNYFDYTATTPVLPQVLSQYSGWLETCFANPASPHQLGIEAKKLLLASLKQIASVFGCNDNEIIITSGGTESINTALRGIRGTLPKRIMVSTGEHDATIRCAEYLNAYNDTHVEYVPLLPDGTLDFTRLEELLQCERYDLMSFIQVNNETGAMLDVAKVVNLRQKYQPKALIHLDGVQAAGKILFNFAKSGVDAYSLSGHKLGAPKGIGALILKNNHRLLPLLHGGMQQNNRRSGTENPPLVAALASACQITADCMSKKHEETKKLNMYFRELLSNKGVPHIFISNEACSPYICTLSFLDILGETMRNALSTQGFYVSVGSACSSGNGKHKLNHVLAAQGISDKQNRHSIRISFHPSHVESQINELAAAISQNCQKFGGKA